jgi:hypothetical protein
MGWLTSRKADWRNFRHLSRTEKRLLAVSMGVLPLIVLVHRFLGFRHVQWALGRLPPVGVCASCPEIQSMRLARSTWRVVQIAANRSPCRATCLQQSICLHWLLTQRGIASDLRIGISKHDGQFEAHAWVECLGQAVNETADVKTRYAPFPRAQLGVV